MGAALINNADWAKLRQEARQVMPDFAADSELPDILLPYQQNSLITTAENQVTVVEKSRRTGFTWGTGSDAVLTAATKKSDGGMDVMYIGYNLDMAREFIDVCAMWAKTFNDAASEVEEFVFKDQDKNGDNDIRAFRITFASGFEITALSSRPRSLRGRQGYVIIDEAAFHDDLPELLKAAMAMLIWGGKVLVISTHDGEQNPFNVLVEDIRAGRKPYALIRLDFDQALKDGLYERICLVTGQEWTPEKEAAWRDGIIAFYGADADEELFCIPSKGSGTYIPVELIEACKDATIPVLRLEQPATYSTLPEAIREAGMEIWCRENLDDLLAGMDQNLKSTFGMDFARVSDLSVIWPQQVGQKLIRRPPFIVELRGIPHEQQKQILFHILDRLPNLQYGIMDAKGNGSYLAEKTADNYGHSRIEQLDLSNDWYLTHMPKFKAAFEDGTMRVPADPHVVDDIRAIKKIDGIPKVPKLRTKDGASTKASAKRHGDAAIAAALAYVASITKVEEFAYTPAGRGHGSAEDHDDDSDYGGSSGGVFRGHEGAW